MKRLFFLFAILFIMGSPLLALGAEALVTDLPYFASSTPVFGPDGMGPIAVIRNLYFFALMFGGALAFAMVLYGGVKYMTAGGSHHGAGEAKEIIRDAFLGLLLLMGAYLVLSVVNPDLTVLQLPFMERLKDPAALDAPPDVVWGTSIGCIFEKKDGTEEVQKCFASQQACLQDCGGIFADAAANIRGNNYVCKSSSECRSSEASRWGCLVQDGTKQTVKKCYATSELCNSDCGDGSCTVSNQCTGAALPDRNAVYGWKGAIPPDGTMKDAEARAKLNGAGIRVTGSEVQGDCPTATETGCTSLMGIPPQVIDGLVKLAKDCKCGFRVTGGTEIGHATHGMGKPVVDIEGRNAELNKYIYSLVKIEPGSQQHMWTYSSFVPGDPTFMWEEYKQPQGLPIVHWHLTYP